MTTSAAPTFADPSADGALTPAIIDGLRDGYEMDAGDRARFNAISNNEINDLALNRAIVRGEDGHFSHKIDSKGILDQESSGRCWMFAGFNVMRPKVMRDHKIEGFEFSSAYLQFWDKMEKSNVFLESIIELRDADFLDREWEIVNRWTLGDGGWWNYVTGLIEKYGVVPSEVMPETKSSSNTRTMNAVLERLLRARAVALVKAHQSGAAEGELRALKESVLREVYRFLALNLGEPPAEFEWRYKTKKEKGDRDEAEKAGVEQEGLSPLRKYTPKEFYAQFVGVSLSDYVCLYNDPANEFDRHYRFSRSRNIVGEPDMHFANVRIETMKEVGVKSILANEPLWFAVNMGVDQSRQHGLMELGLYDYETLFGIDLQVGKADRTRFHAGASNHAMALMGVDLADGRPRKWLVENSWGEDKGSKGTWTFYDRWFDEHVYTIIAHKRHIPAETLAIFDQEPEALPAWYPGAQGIPGK